MIDRITAKQAGIPVDESGASKFGVASGPDFQTDGLASQPVPFQTADTDGDPMNLWVSGGHVADLGGKKHGVKGAKNLLDVVKTLCFGMKFDVCLRLNKHGNWAGCIIDRKAGRMARLPLDADMLPCLELVKGDKFPFPSVCDSLTEIAEMYLAADKVRQERLSGRQFNMVVAQPSSLPGGVSQAPDGKALEAMFNKWLDDRWENEQENSAAANKLTERAQTPAPRTVSAKTIYNARNLHDALHRDAKSTVKVFSHPEVKFDPEDGSGKLKAGNELTAEDLKFDNCSVCKQVRAHAPTRHAKGFLQFTCPGCQSTECQGDSVLASKRE